MLNSDPAVPGCVPSLNPTGFVSIGFGDKRGQTQDACLQLNRQSAPVRAVRGLPRQSRPTRHPQQRAGNK